MPIRPENALRYPRNWLTEIRPRILKRASQNAAGWPWCEECGVPDGAIGHRDHTGRWHDDLQSELGDIVRYQDGRFEARVIKIVLTIAHLSDQIEDVSDENLRAWCQRCHNRYDAPMRRRGIQERARAQRAIGDLFA
jgi:hypothetical protein